MPASLWLPVFLRGFFAVVDVLGFEEEVVLRGLALLEDGFVEVVLGRPEAEGFLALLVVDLGLVELLVFGRGLRAVFLGFLPPASFSRNSKSDLATSGGRLKRFATISTSASVMPSLLSECNKRPSGESAEAPG